MTSIRNTNCRLRSLFFVLIYLVSVISFAQDQKAYDAQAFTYLQDAKECIDEYLADYAKTSGVSATEIARASVISCSASIELASTLLKKPNENQSELEARLKKTQEDAALLKIIFIRARANKKS